MVYSMPSSGRIVVVDERRRDYQRLFEECPALPLFFLPDARSALRLTAQKDDHLWLINCVLADGSGLDLLEMLEDRLHRVPVVLIADSYDEEQERQACSTRAALYVCKPLDTRAILACLTRGSAPVRGHPIDQMRFGHQIPSSIDS